MNKELKRKLFHYGGYGNKIKIKMFIQTLPNLFIFVSPFITSLIIDKYFPQNNIKMIVFLSILYYIFALIAILRQGFVNNYTNKYETAIAKKIKIDVLENAVNSKCILLDKYDLGSLIARNTSQSENASLAYIAYMASSYFHRVPILLCNILILIALNYELAVIVIFIYLISNLILLPLFSKTKKMASQLQQLSIEFSSKANEFINSYATTKTLRIEKDAMKSIDDEIKKIQKKAYYYNRIIYIHNALLSYFGFLSLIIIFYKAGINAINGISTISFVILFKEYIDDIDRKMNEIITYINAMNNSFYSFIEVNDLLIMDKEENLGNKKLNNIKSIEFDNVSLSYDNKNMILNGINLKVDKPLTVAIVGKSGAGKTSLVNLIPKFYQLTGGTIFINDVNYDEYELDSLRNKIGYVFQEPVIFNKSVYDNLRYANSDITNEEIENICSEIGLDNKIKSLPEGYNTKISIYTDLLSYGEKQLLNFIREILRNTDIIILDEVTSNLDLEFENQVMKATKKVLENKISFVIAHRLNTIKNADMILFLENGKIVEFGNHTELLNKKGKYYELYTIMEEERKHE